MKIHIPSTLNALEEVVVQAQRWQSAYLCEDSSCDVRDANTEQFALVSSSPLSDAERDIYFSTLSRLIDEYLIAGQFKEVWAETAISLGCARDVRGVQATSQLAQRVGCVQSDGMVFQIKAGNRSTAARYAAQLTFFHILNPCEILQLIGDKAGSRRAWATPLIQRIAEFFC